MQRIIILDGGEQIDRETINAIAAADVVIDAQGAVLRSAGDAAPTQINIELLRRALATQARPGRAKEGDHYDTH